MRRSGSRSPSKTTLINLDTNVLLRSIMMDDEVQGPQAKALMDKLTTEAPGFVSLVALAELVWSLVRLYSFTREQVAELVSALLDTAELRLEAAENVARALRLFNGAKVSFGDCLIASAGLAAGCEYTATFDRKAARDLKMQNLGRKSGSEAR